MAKCCKCGKWLGFLAFETICDSCVDIVIDRERKERSEKQAKVQMNTNSGLAVAKESFDSVAENNSISNLINCPDCKKEVSRRANSCPNCGCPISSNLENKHVSVSRINAKPKCPTCGSIKIQKISTSSKVGKAVLWGIFAIGKISKTFKCNNCGYQW